MLLGILSTFMLEETICRHCEGSIFAMAQAGKI